MDKGRDFICKECKKGFILSEGDIKFYKGNNLSLPKRCFSCRQTRRDANRIDLSKCIGKFITRTKAEWTGDRSFLGKKIELVNITPAGGIVYRYPENSFFYQDGKLDTLCPKSNDGYWKVVE